MRKILSIFAMIIGVWNLSAQKLPKGFEKNTDKFTSVTTLKYSYKLFGGTEVIRLSKDTKDDKVFMSLSAYSNNMVSDQNINQKRKVIILFNDNTTYDAGEETVFSGNWISGLYRYSVHLLMNDQLFEILKEKKIISYRIGNLDYDVAKKGIDLKEQVIYIMEAIL